MTASLRKEGTKYTAAAHAATPHAAIPATWPLLRPIVVQTKHASSVARFAARRSRTQTMKNAKTYQFFDDPKRIMAHFNINLLPATTRAITPPEAAVLLPVLRCDRAENTN